MDKRYVFEATGEVRKPKDGEYGFGGEGSIYFFEHGHPSEFPILRRIEESACDAKKTEKTFEVGEWVRATGAEVHGTKLVQNAVGKVEKADALFPIACDNLPYLVRFGVQGFSSYVLYFSADELKPWKPYNGEKIRVTCDDGSVYVGEYYRTNPHGDVWMGVLSLEDDGQVCVTKSRIVKIEPILEGMN